MPSPVGFNARPVDGTSLSPGVIGIECGDELFTGKLIAGTTMPRLMLLGADVCRAHSPEGLTLYLGAASADWIFPTRVPLAGGAVKPTGANQRLRHGFT